MSWPQYDFFNREHFQLWAQFHDQAADELDEQLYWASIAQAAGINTGSGYDKLLALMYRAYWTHREQADYFRFDPWEPHAIVKHG